jgi:hypothetical protein
MITYREEESCPFSLTRLRNFVCMCVMCSVFRLWTISIAMNERGARSQDGPPMKLLRLNEEEVFFFSKGKWKSISLLSLLNELRATEKRPSMMLAKSI